MRILALLAALLPLPATSQTPGDGDLPVQRALAAARTARPHPAESLSAGAATVPRRAIAEAVSTPRAGLGPPEAEAFMSGRRLFRKVWVAAPAPVPGADGLGPLFNARACRDCHDAGGRGRLPADGPAVGLVLRVALPGGDAPETIADWIATRPHPAYGHQIQDAAAPGLRPEGRVAVTWTDLPVPLAGGEVVTLRRPVFSVSDVAYGPIGDETPLSARIAPPMFGLGLLEAIPEADILALADPMDGDGDGISGRPALVPDAGTGSATLGRFGWKAAAPTVRAQSAEAFSADMGLSSVLHPDPAGDCTAAQTACQTAPNGQTPGAESGHEVGADSLNLVTFYAANLGVPARSGATDREVQRGKALFHNAQCAACHVPAFAVQPPGRAPHLIWPYTDLLLHDMGPGLADGLPEGRASGAEWRTPPLWGLGLTAAPGLETGFLHDGRARTILEAILWHGGEAQAARDAVASMPPADRAALLAFLESL
jgi:CxxC motif-containing protein (DUF1111 family)